MDQRTDDQLIFTPTKRKQRSTRTVKEFYSVGGENRRKHSILSSKKSKEKGKGFQRGQENNYFQGI